MSNEYEFIFNQFTASTKTLNFHERDEYGEFTKAKNSLNVKWNVNYNRPSGKITDYYINLFDFYTNKQVLFINYQSNVPKFEPEQEKYYEPSWKDFTDNQLKKAIDYLTPLLQMRMETDRSHYNLLVFKDKFHLGIRIKNMWDDLEHNLCITAYDVDLDKL